MSVNKTRGVLYQAAKFLGDFQAVSSGDSKKIARRAGRRATGKLLGRGMGKLFR